MRTCSVESPLFEGGPSCGHVGMALPWLLFPRAAIKSTIDWAA